MPALFGLLKVKEPDRPRPIQGPSPNVSNARNWGITNLETDETIYGDFEAENLVGTYNTQYAHSSALGKQSPITQYLHGDSDTLAFTGMFRARFEDDTIRVKRTFQRLKTWAERDKTIGRPPIVMFVAGNGDEHQLSVITSISDVNIGDFTSTGAVRQYRFHVQLRKYTKYTIQSGPPHESRYHNVMQGEYMELLASREYGSPMLGELIRKRHPDLVFPQAGDIVKLPSIEAINQTPIRPTSVPLLNLNSKANTQQRDARTSVFDRLNVSKISYILPKGV